MGFCCGSPNRFIQRAQQLIISLFSFPLKTLQSHSKNGGRTHRDPVWFQFSVGLRSPRPYLRRVRRAGGREGALELMATWRQKSRPSGYRARSPCDFTAKRPAAHGFASTPGPAPGVPLRQSAPAHRAQTAGRALGAGRPRWRLPATLPLGRAPWCAADCRLLPLSSRGPASAHRPSAGSSCKDTSPIGSGPIISWDRLSVSRPISKYSRTGGVRASTQECGGT